MMRRLLLSIPTLALFASNTFAQAFMTNVGGRHVQSLDGTWQGVVDWYDYGKVLRIFRDAPPESKAGFNEYSFDGLSLTVPGDWNHQAPELKYYEGSLWYKRTFRYKEKPGKRLFLYFAGVSYRTDVYLNGELLGSHEGSFTPFQFEVTGRILPGENKLILRVNNQRLPDGIPAQNFDWWNYGGITRDVGLIETSQDYIDDYFIQLKKGSLNEVEGWVRVSNRGAPSRVTLRIPEANIIFNASTDSNGYAKIDFKGAFSLWSPEHPKRYEVEVETAEDTVREKIGFRSIEVRGTQILLNGKPVFLKGINFHEEASWDERRAVSDEDARRLLTWAKELGCNFIRLAHYPQNEHTVRMAEEMGFMLWEEIPVWQGIQFTDPAILDKAGKMLAEMVTRDKNRCGIIIWSLSNETQPTAPKRNETIINMAAACRKMDSTRLISSAFNHFTMEGNKVIVTDTLAKYLDVLAANLYMGWYKAWPGEPGSLVWESRFDKPMIMTEFGAEALYGNHGPADSANLWTEEFQEKVYQDNIKMFAHIPFLAGTCPWNLVDFRSPLRLNARYQQGWNRKGLLSDKGEKKKSWYIMKAFYAEMDK